MSSNSADFETLAYAFGKPDMIGRLKKLPRDFIVEEIIDYPLSGEGEHLWCWVEKCQQNTDWVAGQLAKWAGTAKKNVGFAGQKDRQAITRQWFSIHLPGKTDPDLASLNIDKVKILKSTRHHRKLQRGGLAGNHFELRLRDLHSVHSDEVKSVEEIKKTVEKHLQWVKREGVPNYFGTQRFGHNGQNLNEAEKLFTQEPGRNSSKKRRSSGHNQKGMYLSAVRSWMFNALLSERVQNQSWNRVISGDVVQLEGSKKWFLASESPIAELEERARQQDLHPCGVLFGDGSLVTERSARDLEENISNLYHSWHEGLKKLRVQPDRRAFRVIAKNLSWSWLVSDQGLDLQVQFDLPAGSYATMFLREILQVTELD